MASTVFLICQKYFRSTTHIAPLIVFRIVFGLTMTFSSIRFLALGWLEEQYIQTKFHFTYYGFEWVKPIDAFGMNILYVILIISALCITVGAMYKIATVFHFLIFTYIELLDKTYYLNHYYFVSVISFLLIFLPAQKYFSIDVLRNPKNKINNIPCWMIDVLKLQLGIVYFYAGLAKINYDWLIRAMPLSIWLPANDHMPLLGFLFRYKYMPFVFSWCGMIFDVCIPFLLLHRRIRPWAYLILLFFHGVTGWLFQIGVFPLIMSAAVLIFFSTEFHLKLLKYLGAFPLSEVGNVLIPKYKWYSLSLVLFFIIQLLLPWRYLLYPGNLFWTEEGYRFSWRVMLVEKAGTATFYVKNPITKREGAVINEDFLNQHQIKQMAYQPDMILQFAHYLANHYEILMGVRPEVRAEVFVTVNGSASKMLIDPTIDLAKEKESFLPKKWILSANK